MQFKSTEKTQGDTLYLSFEGSIDEDVVFPKVNLSLVKKAVIDLGAIRAINSGGVRKWLEWIRPLAQAADVLLERCPKSMVLQFNMVEGFLPPKVRVKSFYLPYFCRKCDYEVSHLVTSGKELIGSGAVINVQLNAKGSAPCKDANCALEPDQRLFRAIKGKVAAS